MDLSIRAERFGELIVRTPNGAGLRFQIRPYRKEARISIHENNSAAYMVRNGGTWSNMQALVPDPESDTRFLNSVFEQLALLDYMKLRNVGSNVICVGVEHFWQVPHMYLMLGKLLTLAAAADGRRVISMKVVWH